MSDGELTRRDTLLAAAGVTAAGGLGVYELLRRTPGPASAAVDLSETRLETLVAVSEVVYPWPLADPGRQLSLYVRRLSEERTAALVASLDALDVEARSRFGQPFRRLSRDERRAVFTALGVDRVASRPDGTLPARIRFHVVNSVLYALMTHPTGTAPFGISNPVGFPGGIYSAEEDR